MCGATFTYALSQEPPHAQNMSAAAVLPTQTVFASFVRLHIAQLQAADPPQCPLQYLRGVPHLRPRTATIAAAARIRNTIICATHGFFQSHGFKCLSTPLMTTSDCEGAGEMFQVAALCIPLIARTIVVKMPFQGLGRNFGMHHVWYLASCRVPTMRCKSKSNP